MPYAYHVPAYKLGRWDGCVSFFSIGGVTFTNLLEDIIPTIIGNGYEIELEDHRDHTKLPFDPVDETTFQHKVWPKGHPVEGQPVTLRDYQIQIVNQFLFETKYFTEL